jgi:pyridoxamine 5'-phosphate oxidase
LNQNTFAFTMDDLREYINKLRHDFSRMTLDETMADPDPVKQFETWFRAAVDARVNEPNAMVVSTVGADMRPSARILLLRGFSPAGFVFYTNYNSRKGREIAQNPFCCLTFFWPELERQVRIEGRLQKQSPEESDAYFMSRPRSSRLGAWTSPQSEIIASRKALDEILARLTAQFEGKEILRPDWWGGYTLEPDRFEFWQGRESRLHDRIFYARTADSWQRSRLAP